MSKTIQRSARVEYSAAQMFDLVRDVESYPEFMQECVGAAVLESDSEVQVAKLDLARGGLRQSFTTRNTMAPPERITMELVDGPFKALHGLWQFVALGDTSCEVSFKLDYEFKNFLLGAAASPLMNAMVADQVNAMCERAQVLYG